MVYVYILRNFEIQTHHPIPAIVLDLVLINTKKKNLSSGRFCRSSRSLSKNKRKRKDKQIFGFCQRAKKNYGTGG